jgi:opacity protein-like surface antigen
MKRSILAVFCLVLLVAAASAHAQVVPSAEGSNFYVNAGGMGSVFQPDYAGEGIAQTSPNRLYGVGAYVDVHINRWVQIEGEGRWMRFHKYLGIDEDNYEVGMRLPVMRNSYHGLTPYTKVLAGVGNGSFLTGRCFTLNMGGGVDYHLSRKWTLRAIDFEYQEWHVTPTLYPYGFSAGLAYRIFR